MRKDACAWAPRCTLAQLRQAFCPVPFSYDKHCSRGCFNFVLFNQLEQLFALCVTHGTWRFLPKPWKRTTYICTRSIFMGLLPLINSPTLFNREYILHTCRFCPQFRKHNNWMCLLSLCRQDYPYCAVTLSAVIASQNLTKRCLTAALVHFHTLGIGG